MASVESLGHAKAPVVLNAYAAVRWYLDFARDQLVALMRSRDAYGPFLKLRHPFMQSGRALFVAFGAEFNREVLGDPATWRTSKLSLVAPQNSAARRLTKGLLGTTGREHQHYRGLLLPPLRRQEVNAAGEALFRLADEAVASPNSLTAF